ncbi:nuclear transport factor 2 family protein [Rufibacter sp. LB8]|uniref:nuclear transport factor 2 family protein n=1 Tax=Rufibacter sp. LB8 TaxID=2777781 RepID=UPI00178C4ACF|nr:nuclear transport factor 2 family protein [Rufibacter sp. LB8]
MKRIVCLLALCLAFIGSVAAQTKDERKVAAAVEALKNAMLSGEKQALQMIVADQLSYGHSSGKIEDKATFIETLASGKSDFVTMELTNQTVQVTGKTAVVRHQIQATTNDSGTPGTVKLGILLVWQKQGGHWKLLARQAFKL